MFAGLRWRRAATRSGMVGIILREQLAAVRARARHLEQAAQAPKGASEQSNGGAIEPRGAIDLKGKGSVRAYFVNRPR